MTGPSGRVEALLAGLRGWLEGAADEPTPAAASIGASHAADATAAGRVVERATALPSLADFLQ